MTTRFAVFVSSRLFPASNNRESKICETRITFDVYEDVLLGFRQYHDALSKRVRYPLASRLRELTPVNEGNRGLW
jgi:hypothetical protein